MGGTCSHWEEVYTAKSETAVRWYQLHSVRSLELIDAASPDHAASVLDVGGGVSTLIDDLLAQGFSDLAVLDIAETALCKSKAGLGNKAASASWIVADITRWRPTRNWDIWHDCAVFHFLTEQAQQDTYIAALSAATRVGSTIIITTFALDGPEKCSGLPVQRYSPATLAARLGSHFGLTAGASETHATPQGTKQRFSYATLRRLS